jgi:HK97 family phage prohead protease
MHQIIVDPRAMRARDRLFKKYGAALFRERRRSAKSKIDEAAAKEPRWCIEGLAIETDEPIANQQGEIIVLPLTAFDAFIASGQRPEFWLGHDKTKVVGSGVELCAMNIGVAFRMELTNKQYAAAIKQMVESNRQDSISIGFTEIKVRNEVVHGHRVRFIDEALIREISLVSDGASKRAFARIIDANKEPPLSESASSVMFGIEYDLHNVRALKKNNDVAIDHLQQRLEALEARTTYHDERPCMPMTSAQSNRLQTERYEQMISDRRAKLRNG